MFLGTEGVVNDIDVNGLNIVDRDTAALTFLGTYKAGGPPNLFNNVRAIEFDPAQRMLLGIDFGGPLLIIDSSTGAATVLRDIITPNNGFFGMAFVTHNARAVDIDIKPDSFPNSINPRSTGVIPVAILTTDSFDATTVDPATVLFGATGTEAAAVHSALEDVDGDGDTDMILHFNTQATGIACGDTSASLTGETIDGQMIEGSDSIKTVGCK